MNNRTETGEQQAVIEWSLWNRGRYPELETLHHTVNEGKRSVTNGAMLKNIGMSKGFPDLSLHCAKGAYHSLHIEMKKDRRSRVSKEQKDWIARLNRWGNCAVICYCADEAIRVLKKYLNLKPGERIEP